MPPRKDTDQPNPPWRFQGFVFPTTTPIPDQVFDELLPRLTGNELKVLLYICRRTFGFKRESDNISLNQMLDGIVKKDGTRLDGGVGLSKPTLLRALKSLREQEIILVEHRSSAARGNQPTNYRLNIRTNYPPQAATKPEEEEEESDPTLGKKMNLGGSQNFTKPLVKKRYPQQTVLQQTDRQQHSPKPVGNNNTSASRGERGAGASGPVVVALTKRGMTKTVAKRLAGRYSDERITQKIDFLDFLIETSPDKVKSPTGFLRRAIEDDWAAPDGYVSPEQREAERQQREEEEREQAEWSRSLNEAREQSLREQQAKEQALLDKAWKRYGTKPEYAQTWQEILARLKPSITPAAFAMFEQAHLLGIKNEQAILGARNKAVQEMLEHRLANRLLKEFESLGMKLNGVQAVLLE